MILKPEVVKFDIKKDWDDLSEEACILVHRRQAERGDTFLGLTHSPMPTGNMMLLFTNTPDPNTDPTPRQTIVQDGKNKDAFHVLDHVEVVDDNNDVSDEAWDALFNRMVEKFLNKKIPPHKLVSVSFFEDTH